MAGRPSDRVAVSVTINVPRRIAWFDGRHRIAALQQGQRPIVAKSAKTASIKKPESTPASRQNIFTDDPLRKKMPSTCNCRRKFCEKFVSERMYGSNPWVSIRLMISR